MQGILRIIKNQLLDYRLLDIIKSKEGRLQVTESVKNELSDICRIIDDTVDTEKIYLFGSYAYGTPNRDSDYDLCVIIPENSMRPVDAVKAIHRAPFSMQSVPLDVIAYRSDAFR